MRVALQGMYLQLLAQSQPAAPISRRGNANFTSRRRDGSSGRGDGGGGSSSRAAGRFAFINAVMAHARDGGDPLDIEEACASQGFAQDGYKGTPQGTSSTSLTTPTTPCLLYTSPSPRD